MTRKKRTPKVEKEVTVTFDVQLCIYCGGYFHGTAQEVRFMYAQGECTCVMCMTCDKRMLKAEEKVTNHQGSFCYSCAFGFVSDKDSGGNG